MMTRLVALICIFSLALVSCENKQAEPKEVVEEENKSTNIEDTKTVDDSQYILFYGNSLTAGYGLDEEYAFPSLIQNTLDSLEMNYKVINAGLSGETTAGGLSRIKWVLKQKIDVFVLELGANDMLRGLDVSETRKNLQLIIDEVKNKNPNIKIVLAGMQAAPNMGEPYIKAFNSIYPDLASANGAKLIPFLLDGVAGIEDLNLQDGKHPNAEGQKIVRENVWRVLKEIL